MPYMSAYPAAWEKIHTKAELKRAVKEGRNVEFYASDVSRQGYISVKELEPGVILTVTNHPKRTWFANVERKGERVVVS